jgi:hypothetical protein
VSEANDEETGIKELAVYKERIYTSDWTKLPPISSQSN